MGCYSFLVLFALAFVGSSLAQDFSVIPPAIAVNASAGTFLANFTAQGIQEYNCVNGAWSDGNESAVLYNGSTIVGAHYRNPGAGWTYNPDGSTVHAARLVSINDPFNATANDQWFLANATAHTGSGLFSKVKYVQRVQVVGGEPPSPTCTAGTFYNSSYTASYLFYNPVTKSTTSSASLLAFTPAFIVAASLLALGL
eukprot:Phypoly_transcript_16903.p1 GENE.Phypoly_transcript_16903~~Phypoly_transcript_16903.p1  ORF type:complete len:198 (+),score=20.82 Phypoly_transcript_16903:215-808(+)